MAAPLIALWFLATNAIRTPEDRIADYTLWLTIFTAALATVSAIQIGFLIRSDKTARMSAEAAKKSAEIGEASLIVGSRALVSALDMTAYWEPGTNADHFNWRFRTRWQNNGKTPTKNMRLYTACELRNSQLPPGFNFNQIATPPGHGLLAPTATSQGGLAPAGPAITPQDIVDIQANRKFLYLWGWARYYDVFPNTPEHTTMFCWRIFPSGDPMAPNANTEMTFSTLHQVEGNTAT